MFRCSSPYGQPLIEQRCVYDLKRFADSEPYSLDRYRAQHLVKSAAVFFLQSLLLVQLVMILLLLKLASSFASNARCRMTNKLVGESSTINADGSKPFAFVTPLGEERVFRVGPSPESSLDSAG